MTIDPQDMIDRLTVEDLCVTAENYFKSIPDPTPQMAKPFNSVLEASIELQNLGVLLSGLHLGQTMTVVDFGAGSCWLSRFLTQLQCQTISCDVSETALEIGERLFAEHPIIGAPVAEPRFLHLDGHTIDLPDRSVDRIVCFGAFHHVPNQGEVLAEFYRILKDGGIVGFSEPGRFHSQAPTSQSEMANFNVLENDINLDDIFAIARRCGFTDIKCRLLGDMELSLDAYNLLTRSNKRSRARRLIGAARDLISPRYTDVTWRVLDNISGTMTNRTIFFLHKGDFVPDSRSHVGLAHTIAVAKREYTVTLGERVDIPLRITNTGDGPAETVWMTDVLPAEVDYVTGNATLGSLQETDGIVTWSGSLAPAEAVTIIYVTQIDTALSENTRFTNTAEITGTGSLLTSSVSAEAVTTFKTFFP